MANIDGPPRNLSLAKINPLNEERTLAKWRAIFRSRCYACNLLLIDLNS